jgi:outer membrane protein TolC
MKFKLTLFIALAMAGFSSDTGACLVQTSINFEAHNPQPAQNTPSLRSSNPKFTGQPGTAQPISAQPTLSSSPHSQTAPLSPQPTPPPTRNTILDQDINDYGQAQNDQVSLFNGPNNVQGWWAPLVLQPMRNNPSPLRLSLDELLLRTLLHSSQVRVFSELPMIRRTAIIEADAAFDWTRYLETRWDDLNDPVGSTLTIGGTGDRFINQQYTSGTGLRRRNRVGGEVDIRQNFGTQTTNSEFFVPDRQGTARLILGYTQPLLRGRGKVYNESLTCLAKLDARIADDEFHRQLQSHLLEVTRAYWSLYLERGVLFQKMNSHQRATEIYVVLQKRSKIDAQAAQITSAKASVTTRYSELIRSRMAVKNAEARIRSLVNDPEFGQFDEIELIPMDQPNIYQFNTQIHEAMNLAVRSRPEVLQALKQIKAGQIRLGMSRHEMLPQLNLITQTYVAGLEGDNDVPGAFLEQFSDGRPGYSLGLNYELPIGNRAATARNARRILELRQLKNQYRTTLQTVKLEVEVAVREINTASQEMVAKAQAMEARLAQLDALTKRWIKIPGEDVSAVLALENLLSSQQQLADAEFEFLTSQLTYNLALMNLKRATGVLLQTEGVNISTTVQDGVPTHVLSKFNR